LKDYLRSESNAGDRDLTDERLFSHTNRLEMLTQHESSAFITVIALAKEQGKEGIIIAYFGMIKMINIYIPCNVILYSWCI
jgi:hypothetical protein